MLGKKNFNYIIKFLSKNYTMKNIQPSYFMTILKANKIYLTKLKTSSLRLKNSFLTYNF